MASAILRSGITKLGVVVLGAGALHVKSKKKLVDMFSLNLPLLATETRKAQRLNETIL